MSEAAIETADMGGLACGVSGERMKMILEGILMIARRHVGNQVVLIPVIESADFGYRPTPVRGYVKGVSVDGVLEIDEVDNEREGEIVTRRIPVIERREECGTIAWMAFMDNDSGDDGLDMDEDAA